MAVLSFAGPVAALLTILAADGWLMRGLIGRLGLSAGRALRGIAMGVGAALIICPLMVLVAGDIPFENLMETMRITHPPVVKVLQVLGSTPHPAVRNLIILTAVIVAPVFEEVFFRGHIQTLLVAAILGRAAEGRTLDDTSSRRSASGRVTAIVLTSLLFALVHEAWTSPAIFILSAIAWGTCTNGRGILWTSIALHATFNIVSITGFLLRGP